MKMTPEHYEILKKELDEKIDVIGIGRVREHRAKQFGKDIEMRFRWDLFSAAQGFYLKLPVKNNSGSVYIIGIHECYSDNHIDTALKHYVKNNPDLN